MPCENSARKRSKTMAFRCTPEEHKLICEMAAWSGMLRQDYIIARLTDTEVEVRPSVSMQKALKDSMVELAKEVKLAASYGELSYSLPFTKVVKKGGDIAPGKQEFGLEVFDVGVGQIEDYSDVTITATVATNGEGEYESALTIQGPKKQVDNITCEGFCVREKSTGIANWTYSDAVYQIFCNDGATDNQGTAQPSFEVFPVELVATDSGEFYEKTQDTPVDVMTSENVYTEKAAPAEDTKPTEGSDPNANNKSDAGDKPAAATPRTGDGNAPIIAIVALVIVASALFASALRMKKY